MDGKGLPQSLEKGHRWMLAAAEQGDATSQLNLGGCILRMSEGKPEAQQRQAFKTATDWCRKSAAQGNEDARRKLRQLEAHPMYTRGK